jgi:hypothetical protein
VASEPPPRENGCVRAHDLLLERRTAGRPHSRVCDGPCRPSCSAPDDDVVPMMLT